MLVDAEDLEAKTMSSNPAAFHKAWHDVYSAQGLLVPGGFGDRGTEGMIAAIRSARENGTPFLGICLGMQMAVVEWARNVCGFTGASSEEFAAEKTADSVIIRMEELDNTRLGGTQRCGLRETVFQPGSQWSKMRALYENDAWAPLIDDGKKDSRSLSQSNGTVAPLANGRGPPKPSFANSVSSKPFGINERHRHRYEVSPDFIDKLTTTKPSPTSQKPSSQTLPVPSSQVPVTTTDSRIPISAPPLPSHSRKTEPSIYELHFVGKDTKGERMEILELKHHPWFVGVQFHPEYLSRVLKPSKPYLGFVAAAAGLLGNPVGGFSSD